VLAMCVMDLSASVSWVCVISVSCICFMMWPVGGSFSAGDVCRGFVCICVVGLCCMLSTVSCY